MAGLGYIAYHSRIHAFSPLQNQYQNLLALANERKNKLKETVKAYVLVREAAELSQWIRDKASRKGLCNVHVVTSLMEYHDRDDVCFMQSLMPHLCSSFTLRLLRLLS